MTIELYSLGMGIMAGAIFTRLVFWLGEKGGAA
jgi:hypothetical protein